MSVSENKRSEMTLFSGDSDLYSHRARIVLAEKAVCVNISYLKQEDKQNWPAEVMESNPYQTVPVLIDRDLILYNSRIIMEYLDERFPHPPLMPVYPVERAKSSQMMYRLEKDWYPLVDLIMGEDITSANDARVKLQAFIVEIAPIFDHYDYFMSDVFTLVDCYMAPLLWRLPFFKIDVDHDLEGLKAYMIRVFGHESFQASLTEVEREIRMCV
ncbi:MAG: glutathione S-transferase N-terminal domain-containing protein [Psychromonas sp.]|nr:glutathione S-transferase N-terminal domain-containing protein [Psychromonas sp.]